MILGSSPPPGGSPQPVSALAPQVGRGLCLEALLRGFSSLLLALAFLPAWPGPWSAQWLFAFSLAWPSPRSPPLERNWVDVAMVAEAPSTYYVSPRGTVFVFGRAPL